MGPWVIERCFPNIVRFRWSPKSDDQGVVHYVIVAVSIGFLALLFMAFQQEGFSFSCGEFADAIAQAGVRSR